ncbi:MAG: hypothetical protein HYX92_00165 [Chloroflexi bacterium]|nr:hypothetical protein [Chloroflexota bacterium]
MQGKKLFAIASCLTILGLVAASCAPAAAPSAQPPVAPLAKQVAPTPKPAEPATKPAAPTPKPAEPAASPKPAAQQPRHGGILDRANYEDPVTLDVHQESSVNSQLSLANIYNALVKLHSWDIDKVVPDLAEKWEANADGTAWTFHLRKGVKWHDGKPLTAEDARFSLERIAFPKQYNIVSPRAGTLLTAMKSAEALDETTVRVSLKYASASFIGNIAAGWVLIMPKHTIQEKGNMKKDVNGTGPFTWKSYTQGVMIELPKNKDYFLKDRPYLDGIRIFTLKDSASRFAAFRTGRVKMTTMGSSGLSQTEAAIVKRDMADTAVVQPHPANMRFGILLPVTKAPWNDLRVRRAAELVFDRQAAVKLNANVGSLGAAMDPKGLWGIPEEEMSQRPGYRQPKDADITAAKRLLAEAGYPQGFKTTILNRTTTQDLGVYAKDQLAKIDIEATIEVKESGLVTQEYVRGSFEVGASYLSEPVDDPDVVIQSGYVTGGGRNYGQFSDKQIDDMYEKQARTMDSQERKKIVRQIQERLLELVPSPTIYWNVYNMGNWKEVMGYKPGVGVSSHNSLADVWLAR